MANPTFTDSFTGVTADTLPEYDSDYVRDGAGDMEISAGDRAQNISAAVNSGAGLDLIAKGFVSPIANGFIQVDALIFGAATTAAWIAVLWRMTTQTGSGYSVVVFGNGTWQMKDPSDNVLDSGSVTVSGLPKPMKLLVNGNLFEFFWDGVLEGSATDNDRAIGDFCSMQCRSPGATNTEMDNLSVEQTDPPKSYLSMGGMIVNP